MTHELKFSLRYHAVSKKWHIFERAGVSDFKRVHIEKSKLDAIHWCQDEGLRRCAVGEKITTLIIETDRLSEVGSEDEE